MFCTKCGAENEDNNAFCTNCGEKLVTNNTGSQSVASNSGVFHTHNSMKIKMIAGIAVIVIVVACSLMFIGTKIGEEDFISVDKNGNELAYRISDEDMYAISLREDTDGTIKDYASAAGADTDIASLDSDDTMITENYLNSGMDTTPDSALTAAGTELQMSDDAADGTLASNTDEAVFTSASGVSTLADAKLLKEQMRAQNKEALLEIIQNDELTEEAKREAVNSMIVLTETAQKESDAQMLLEAKGFTNTVVSISGDCVDVMIETVSLTEAQTAQVIDIVQRKTGIAPENIIITVLDE